jgi:hypothetical protein
MHIDELIQQGRAILEKNLQAFPSFDPNKPYHEKNSYFAEVSDLAAGLFQNDGLVIPAEKFYGQCSILLHNMNKKTTNTLTRE